MATYVLVAGYWLGGWAWADVGERLRKRGHAVHAATLTGLGDREHLGGPEVKLDTHAQDIINLIRYDTAQDASSGSIILVGHSYAGVVITVVADRIPEKLRRLVYVDSGPMPHGMAQADFYPPALRKQYEQTAAAHDGWRLPLPPWSELDQGNTLDGLGAAQRQHFRERATDMPFGAALQPVSLRHRTRPPIPRTAICCTFTSQQIREMARGDNPIFREMASPDWQFIDLPTGHWPMFSKPEDLAQRLHELEPRSSGTS